MNNDLEKHKVVNLNKTNRRETSIQLKFNIPKKMLNGSNFSVDVHLNADSSIMDNSFILAEENAQKVIDINQANGTLGVTNLCVSQINEITNPVSISSPNEISSIDIHIHEDEDQVYPYFGLKLKNAQEVYKIGMSYVKDINLGKKHFGFSTMSKKINDLHLLVYGSFINYSIKRPVLIIVRDLSDKSFDSYRCHFTTGSLGGWPSKEWGNLCLIDHKQLKKQNESFKPSDFKIINSEFAAVLWALPSENLNDNFQKMAFEILNNVSSITYVIKPGETKNKDLNRSAQYYQCFDIGVKGILVGENVK